MYSTERFTDLVSEFTSVEASLLKIKRSEYTQEEDDCLQNFRQVGDFLGLEPEMVCLVYLTKHFQSIQRAVESGEYSFSWWDEQGNVEGLKQRISDLRNYLLLLSAILDEKEGSE